MQDVIKSYAERMLDEYLNYKIPASEAEAYYAFCRQANSDLIRNSLKELKGFAKSCKTQLSQGKEPPPFLPKLTRIYFRKVEEQARLFMALSIFEAAYRVHLSNWMEHHYDARTWWEPVYNELLGGGVCTNVATINNTSVLPAVANAIERLLKGVDGYELKGEIIKKQNGGHSLLCHSKLSDLEELIREQWVSFKPSLGSHNPALTTLPSFISAFKRIRDARNSCFHHREVADRAGLIKSIENMLDLIHVHLDTASINARTSAVKPLPSSVLWNDRHDFGLVPSLPYEIELHLDGEMVHSITNGRTQFEAIQRTIDGLAADDRIKLNSIRVGTKKGANDVTIDEAIKSVGTVETTFQLK